MIASRKYGFIFIKTMKTAGTSIEMAIGPHCGPEDILSPINPKFDRQRVEAGVYPRNFAPEAVVTAYVDALKRNKPKAAREAMALIRKKGNSASSHARAVSIKAVAGDLWDTAFKFTAERHPYEKAVSLAFHVNRHASRRAREFGEALETVVRSGKRYVGYPWYIVGGQVIVDDFVKHETIQADMQRICERVGLPAIELPRARELERDRKPAREMLTAEQRRIVQETCAPEFELFGWER
ncbi:hypothetical protein [Reyranella sp.]|uniref:hypothetical protein n=1 Tax=Reyranella sp. TaxID=1929291 RepID=UPI002718AA47|nr:hypothetical protein [Reyranella sp.]MDO8972354.1 hypothetical protein [Reyranella sp.]